MAGLHWIDIVILSGFLLISLAIGIYQALTGGHQSTIEEFLLANRKLKVIPTALSVMASLRSSITLLGSPAEIYSWGTQLLLSGDTLACILTVTLVERFIVPWLYRLHLTSAYEYLEIRFHSKAVRRFASTLGIIYAVLYMGSAILAPSVAIQVAAGLPIRTSILLMACFCAVYTALGGMRGVVWTDVLQSGIMFGGILFIIIQGTQSVGSFQEVITISREEGRLFFANFSMDPYSRMSFWPLLFSSILSGLHFLGTQQAVVQRYVALPTLGAARRMVLLFMLATTVFAWLCGGIGLIQYAYFSKSKCDPLESKLASSANQLFPLFMKMLLGEWRGFKGVILMVLYSCSLSTVSSMLSGCAANTWEDFLKPCLGHKVTEYQATLINKFLVILYAALSVCMAFFAANFPSNILKLTITFLGAVGAPSSAIYLLGGLTERCEWIGALVGGIAGFSVNIILGLGATYFTHVQYHPLPSVEITGCTYFINSTLGEEALASYSIATSNMTEAIDLEATNSKLFSPIIPLQGIHKLFGISPFWYGTIGNVVTFGVGYIVSCIVWRYRDLPYNKIDKKLLISLKDALTFNEGHTRGEKDGLNAESETIV